jgi:hypothetical protein
MMTRQTCGTRILICRFLIAPLLFQAAYQATMTKVNEKLKNCIEQQTMSDNTFEKLSDLLDAGNANVDEDAMDDPEDLPAIDAVETTKVSTEIRGENRVLTRLTPSKRSKRRKLKLDTTSIKAEKQVKEPRKQPRFLCQF